MTISLNPMQTTNAGGSFFDSSDGYVAGGMAYPDPAALQKLRIGTILAAASGLFYGGVGLNVQTPPVQSELSGAQLQLATAINGAAPLNGFAVWDQADAGIQTPGSPVPLYAPSQTMSFFSFGAGAAIALPIDSAVASGLLGVSENTPLSWDYTNQKVIAYTGAGANAGAIPGARILDIEIGNSKIVTPNSPSAGLASWNEQGSTIVLLI